MSDRPGQEEVDGFLLPELPRLLPVAYHPKAAQIEFRSNAWVRHHLGECCTSEAELLKLLRQRVGLYGPLVAPHADEQRATDLADFYHFVGLIDDLAADRGRLGGSTGGARAVFERILADFGRGSGGGSPFGRAAADLWSRISPGLSPRQQERFAASLEAFLRGIAAELPHQLGGSVPDYDTYLAIRLESFGCDFIALLTEYAAEVDLSELLDHPQLRAVYAASMRQMILVNDVLSLRKEHGDPMNAVRVLIHHEARTLQGAVDEVCARAAGHERDYLAARDAVLAGELGALPEVVRYLRATDHMLAGAQEFEHLTPRYFGDGSVWDGARAGWIDLHTPTARPRS